MAEHRNQARGANEWNDIYGSLGLTAGARLMNLPLNVLDPWTDAQGRPQRFKPYPAKRRQAMAESIAENGVIEPIFARPKADGRFQILAGHNRVECSGIAGRPTIPCYVLQVDDVQAEEIVKASNMHHRPLLLPSERAWVYADDIAKLDIRQGQRTDRTLDNDCPKSEWSHQIVADRYGVSATSVKQHLRLNQLHVALLDMVDNGALDKAEQDDAIPTMTFVAGYEISFLTEADQAMLLEVMDELHKVPTPAQAKQLHQLAKSWQLNPAEIRSILQPVKAPKTAKAATIKLPAERISAFFPQNTKPEEMEQLIYEALLAYRKNNDTPASV